MVAFDHWLKLHWPRIIIQSSQAISHFYSQVCQMANNIFKIKKKKRYNADIFLYENGNKVIAEHAVGLPELNVVQLVIPY